MKKLYLQSNGCLTFNKTSIPMPDGLYLDPDLTTYHFFAYAEKCYYATEFDHFKWHEAINLLSHVHQLSPITGKEFYYIVNQIKNDLSME